jgi:CheY-like chemotaxis protein
VPVLTRVLIVGDDSFLLAYARSRLEQDYAIRVTTTPPAALSQVQPRAFDVVIFDHEMPTRQEMLFLDRMNETRRDVPVIFCSRQNRPETVDGFYFKGNNILLHKSDDMDLFCDDLAEILHCIRGEYAADERYCPPVSGCGWIERIFLI